MATIDDFLAEIELVGPRVWFVREVEITDRTDMTVTLRLIIDAHLFVQIFFSQRTRRQSLALVGSAGRLFGWDFEHGHWHVHPFGQSERHMEMTSWVPAIPVPQFMSAVEELLITQGLL